MQKRYDIAFLGGGPGGYQGAIRAAQLGASVAVVEEKNLGGICLNWGCIPTKTLRASAEVARAIRRAREYGIQSSEPVVDMATVQARRERVVNGLRRSIEQLLAANRIDIITGRGRLINTHNIEVTKAEETALVETEKVVIATGSRPASLAVFQNTPGVFWGEEIFNLNSLPHDLLVVGGGVIGVEMAAIFRELGSQVTLVEVQSRLLPAEDIEMSDYLQSLLRSRKIKVMCGIEVTSASQEEAKFNIQLSDGTVANPDTVLAAVGRTFNTEGIGLEDAGIALANGCIKVDDYMQTTASGMYAAGDVAGGWLLAHVAFAEGICAAECALGRKIRMDYRVVPRTVFSLPEYSAVGLSEEEAGKTRKMRVARFPFKSLGMGQAMGEVEGLTKIISDAETDQILGAHIIGPHASEMISEIALAMKAGITTRVITETIHVHPTLSEAILEVAQALHGQAIHVPPQEVA